MIPGYFCPNGTFFNETTALCQAIPTPNCFYWWNNECVWCAPRYFLWNGLCYSINGCSRFSYWDGCLECISGYVLRDRQCKTFTPDPNCLRYNSTSPQICLQCASGFYLVAGQCLRLPQNCVALNSQGVCTQCATGFRLSNGQCQSTDPYCRTYNSLGQCSQCVNNYYINSQLRCTPNPRNCAIALQTGLCFRCVEGFTLQNGLCFIPVPLCRTYNVSTGSCSQCVTNALLLGNQCVCGNGFAPNSGTCIQLPTGCL